jgi:hypothetical protein
MKKSTRIGLIAIGILLGSAFIYLIMGFRNERAKNINISNTPIKTPLNDIDFLNHVIEFSKEFAIAYFNGTAFLNPDVQPVSKNYMEYLKIEKNRLEEKSESPIVFDILGFDDNQVIPETDQGLETYAVWLITTIRTRNGFEKKVIFITRVKDINGTLVIETAGTIPYNIPPSP